MMQGDLFNLQCETRNAQIEKWPKKNHGWTRMNTDGKKKIRVNPCPSVVLPSLHFQFAFQEGLINE